MATSYTKTTWVNNSAPAISATNLNNIENFNSAIASGGSGSVVNSDKLEGYNTTTTNKVWVGGVNDGNGGQPPAPKPALTSGVPGTFTSLANAAGNALSLPAGGTWAYTYIGYNTTNNSYYDFGSGIAAGGTQILGATANIRWFTTFCWRIA